VRHAESMVRLRPHRATQGSYAPVPRKPHQGLPAPIVRLLERP